MLSLQWINCDHCCSYSSESVDGINSVTLLEQSNYSGTHMLGKHGLYCCPYLINLFKFYLISIRFFWQWGNPWVILSNGVCFKDTCFCCPISGHPSVHSLTHIPERESLTWLPHHHYPACATCYRLGPCWGCWSTGRVGILGWGTHLWHHQLWKQELGHLCQNWSPFFQQEQDS